MSILRCNHNSVGFNKFGWFYQSSCWEFLSVRPKFPQIILSGPYTFRNNFCLSVHFPNTFCQVLLNSDLRFSRPSIHQIDKVSHRIFRYHRFSNRRIDELPYQATNLAYWWSIKPGRTSSQIWYAVNYNIPPSNLELKVAMSIMRHHCLNEAQLATHSRTHGTFIAATWGPTQVHSRYHTRSSNTKPEDEQGPAGASEPVLKRAEPVLTLLNLLNLRCKTNPKLKMKCARFKNVHKDITISIKQ